jgi:hypothetical protein
MKIRIGTKLAITVGIGVVLVAGMIVNQQSAIPQSRNKPNWRATSNSSSPIS